LIVGFALAAEIARRAVDHRYSQLQAAKYNVTPTIASTPKAEMVHMYPF
jgi:hypothetical protein